MPAPFSNPIGDLIKTYRLNGLGLRKADQGGLLEDLAEPEGLVDGFLKKFDEINRDVRLTTTGKADAARTAGRETLAALDKWIAPKRAGADAHEAQVRAELVAVERPRPSDAATALTEALVRSELRQQIRAAAADLKDAEVDLLFRRGDALVHAALLEAPRVVKRGAVVSVVPWVSQETVDQVSLDAATRMRPELADALHDIRVTREIYEIVASTARHVVAQLAPDVERDVKIVTTRG